jgi:hypothetical protein
LSEFTWTRNTLVNQSLNENWSIHPSVETWYFVRGGPPGQVFQRFVPL